MIPSKIKKRKQLGMPSGTAYHRLKRKIMFDLICQLDLNWCYQCGAKIETVKDFSVEHKEPWLDSANPKELFFDLENIAFSHQSCNYRASRGMKGQRKPCPTISNYRRGCRCDGCRELKRIEQKNYRKKKKNGK